MNICRSGDHTTLRVEMKIFDLLDSASINYFTLGHALNEYTHRNNDAIVCRNLGRTQKSHYSFHHQQKEDYNLGLVIARRRLIITFMCVSVIFGEGQLTFLARI